MNEANIIRAIRRLHNRTVIMLTIGAILFFLINTFL